MGLQFPIELKPLLQRPTPVIKSILAPLALALTLSPAPGFAEKSDTLKQDGTTTFQIGSTTHIIENIPGIKDLVQTGAFWLALHTVPDLISYTALRVYMHTNQYKGGWSELSSHWIYPAITLNDGLRHLVRLYQASRLGAFIWSHVSPITRQTGRWANCLKKTGEAPVYILDKSLSKAFSIKIVFSDDGAYAAFHALQPNTESIARELPAAWRELFNQLRKLPNSTVYAHILRSDRLSSLCLRNSPEQGCDITLSINNQKTSQDTAEPSAYWWDIELAEQWCPQSTLKNTTLSYSIFSTPTIHSIANALAHFEPHSPPTPLSSGLPGRVSWNKNAAVLDSDGAFDYQAGWSGSAIDPASAGFFILSSKGNPTLKPENMAHLLSNWQNWLESQQKRWPATPLHWLNTLIANHVAGKIRNHIHSSSWNLLQENPSSTISQHSTAPRKTTEAGTRASTPYPPPAPPEAVPAVTPQKTIEADTHTSISFPPPAPPEAAPAVTPDYSKWGFENNEKVLMGRSIATELHKHPNTVPGHYRSVDEVTYLQAGQLTPKPATIIIPGVPIKLHLHHFDLVLLLAIEPNKVLAPFKKNINSNQAKDLNNYSAKRHPGILSLTQKLEEMNQRRLPFLNDQSWGSINAKKAKKEIKSTLPPEKYYTPNLIENEVILSGYTKEDIHGIIITENMPLLAQKGYLDPLSTTLKKKLKLEEALGLDSLTLFFYDQNRGSITHRLPLTTKETSGLINFLERLETSSLAYDANTWQLPVFIGDQSFSDYLRQLIVAAIFETTDNTHVNELAPAQATAEELLSLMTKPEIDKPLYKSLAQYPKWLLTRYPLPYDLKKNIRAGSQVFITDLLPLKSVAYFFESKATGPLQDKIIKVYQERALLAEEIMQEAQLSKSFSYCSVTPFDFGANPYAALNWVIQKKCRISSSGTECIIRVLDPMHSLKNSPDAQKQYFDQIITPLFKELIARDKLTSWSLHKSINLIQNSLTNALAKYVIGKMDARAIKENTTLSALISLKRKKIEPQAPPQNPDLDELQNNYNNLAILIYLYKATFGDIKEGELAIQALIDQTLVNLPNTDTGFSFSEISQKAFYPLEDIHIRKAAKNSLSNEATPKTFKIIRNNLLRLILSKIPLTEFKKIFANSILDPEHRYLLAMQVLTPLRQDFTDIAPSPEETTEYREDTALAMKNPLPGVATLTDTSEQTEEVIRHYYQNPNPVHIKQIIQGRRFYDSNDLWRKHHGVDHVTRTVVLFEAVVEFHKSFKQEYANLFNDHPDLNQLLTLAVAYHDATAEVIQKSQEELTASQLLKQDLETSSLAPDTLALVVSALKHKNVNTMNPVPEGYIPDEMASPDERLIRRLIRIPDSIDIARVRIVSDDLSFTSPDHLTDNLPPHIYSMQWMDLDPDLPTNPGLMTDWVALMKTAVFWASLTGASPKHLIHDDPSKLMPYTVTPNLAPWTQGTSQQRKLVISKSPESLNYVREILHDITRLYIAQNAGKEAKNPYQLRQIKLPENWTTLDSFLHFTSARKNKLRPIINFWKKHDFIPHHGTLTHELLSDQTVIDALPPYLFVEQVKRQRGFEPDDGHPLFEDTWELGWKLHR